MHRIERLTGNTYFGDGINNPLKVIKDKGPSARDSSDRWVAWAREESYLGQPFNVNTIPISKLEQMQRDPILAFGLMFIKVPLVRAPWFIQSEDPQRASFVDHALRRIYGRFILSYTNCLAFGYSPMVKRFETINPDWKYVDIKDPEHAEKDVWDDKSVDAITWKPFLALNPRYAAPKWTAKGDFNGIEYTTLQSNSVYNFLPPENNQTNIPLDWSMWAVNEKDSVFGSIYGYPRLGYAYRFWWSYWYKFGLADRAYEKWADPPVMVWHPAADGIGTDGEDVDFGSAALATAEKIRGGANVAIPTSLAMAGLDERGTTVKEWDITQLKSEANFDALNEMFKYLDIQKLRSMMVPEQALIEGNSSARNTAQAFGDIFQESQSVIMQEIDDQINRYMIPQLLELNFGPGGPTCTKVTTGFDPQDVETMRIVVQALANKEGQMPDVDMRQTLTRLGLPLVSPEEALNKIQAADARQNLLDTNVLKQKQLEASLKGHKPQTQLAENGFAGVDENGNYYSGNEVITFSDNERSTMKKVFDKLFNKE